MIKLHFLEILPIVLYLSLLLFLGFRKTDKSASASDFILGGRQLTLPAFVATLVTTWYGGILGVGEFTYLYGLSNWVVFGLPYYIFALIFAIFLAPKIRRTKLLSIPDLLYRNYGRKNGMIGSIYTFFVVLPAPYVLMVGLMVQIITGWPLWICVVAGTLFSMIYILNGGFRAVVRTDKLQFALMFGGFILMLLFLVQKYGGLPFLKENLPPLHLTLHGGNSAQYIIVWFFIAIWTLLDPGFHQRCYAAKAPRTARNGILISILFWMIFDFLTTSVGLFAVALLKDIKPALAYPLLAHQLLPPFLSGLFITGLLATIMSTLDSSFLLSAVTLGHDIAAKFRRITLHRRGLMQIGIFISAILSVSASLIFPSVIQLWYLIGTLFIPPLLIPVLGAYFPVIRMRDKFILWNFLLPFFISLLFLFQSWRISPALTQLTYWLDIQPMYPGLLVSLLLLILSKIKKPA